MFLTFTQTVTHGVVFLTLSYAITLLVMFIFYAYYTTQITFGNLTYYSDCTPIYLELKYLPDPFHHPVFPLSFTYLARCTHPY
jgi:predicted permease